MKVRGFDIPAEVDRACLVRMRKPFRAVDIVAVALHEGALGGSYRFADRLIQRERKAGNIVRDGRGWRKAESVPRGTKLRLRK